MIQKLTFKTKVELNITGSHKKPPGHGYVEIKWQLLFEQNLKGLGEMEIIVPEQDVKAEINYFDEYEDTCKVVKTLHVKDVEVNFYNSINGIEPHRIDMYGDKFQIYF